MTTSRYSLGTTSDAAPAVFICCSSEVMSRSSACAPATSSCRKRLVRRSVVVAKNLHKVRGRPIAKVKNAPLAADLRCCRTVRRVRLGAPKRRRLQSRRWRNVRTDHLEQLADETFGRPIRHPDPAAAAQNAQHFLRSAFVVRREHRTERRQHDVEAIVAERQIFGIGLTKLHGQTLRRGRARDLCREESARNRST